VPCPRTAALLAAVGLIVAARPVYAGVAGLGTSQESPGGGSRLGIESVWAAFDLQGATGDFLGVVARGDLRLSPIVSTRLEIPVYTLHLNGQDARTGVGDIELRIRIRLYDAHGWRLYFGLSDQMPTGNSSLGLGQKATQLAPFLTCGYRWGPVVLYGIVADAFAIRPAGAPQPVDYVDPGSDHELRYSFGSIVEFSSVVYANAALSAITDLVPGDDGRSLAIASASLGIAPSPTWKLVCGLQLPAAGQHLFEEKVVGGLYYFF
jgi:hypothetical protein